MLTDFRWTRALVLLLILPLAACAGDDDADDMDDDDMPAVVAPAPAAAAAVTIALGPKNGSAATGQATAEHMNDSVTVVVNVSNAAADGAHPAHVHSGTCDATGGVLAPLTPVEVTNGAGMSTTTLAAAEVGAGQDAVVQVHNPSGQPILCGDMRGHGDMMEADTAGM